MPTKREPRRSVLAQGHYADPTPAAAVAAPEQLPSPRETQPAPTSAKKEPAAAPVGEQPARPAAARTRRKNEPPPGFVEFNMWWKPGTLELARGAFTAEQEIDPATPATFREWIAAAISTVARMSVQDRVRAIQGAVAAEPGRGLSRQYFIPQASVDDLDAAIAADFAELTVQRSNSDFAVTAVRVAIARAQGSYQDRTGRTELPVVAALRPGRRARA
ncbi:hypothetical protein [Allobranchiibius huperziae]|uniref:Uncharacterized protein n=1 Tax=Allobranchiibius huperziae TaxID=1874116 RepID=A0A853DKB6_9MICO|nr:hypothetical protein [Allobranchiibius huperziae]NYJ76473.1 hypothetical protein [Allobranchiibius huperziae]